VIRTRPPGYVADLDPSQVDARRFEELLMSGRAAAAGNRAAEAAELLSEALGLWRGQEAMEGLGQSFARIEAARLGELRPGAQAPHGTRPGPNAAVPHATSPGPHSAAPHGTRPGPHAATPHGTGAWASSAHGTGSRASAQDAGGLPEDRRRATDPAAAAGSGT